MTMPNRSSIASDSSMKSSESRPIEPSTPLGSAVSSVTSAARRGSNLSRVDEDRLELVEHFFGFHGPPRCAVVSAGRLLARSSSVDRGPTPAPGPDDARRSSPACRASASAMSGPHASVSRPASHRGLERRVRPAAHRRAGVTPCRARAARTPPPRPGAPATGQRARAHSSAHSVERLHREHERPLAAAVRQQPARLPEGVHRGGGARRSG